MSKEEETLIFVYGFDDLSVLIILYHHWVNFVRILRNLLVKYDCMDKNERAFALKSEEERIV